MRTRQEAGRGGGGGAAGMMTAMFAPLRPTLRASEQPPLALPYVSSFFLDTPFAGMRLAVLWPPSCAPPTSADTAAPPPPALPQHPALPTRKSRSAVSSYTSPSCLCSPGTPPLPASSSFLSPRPPSPTLRLLCSPFSRYRVSSHRRGWRLRGRRARFRPSACSACQRPHHANHCSRRSRARRCSARAHRAASCPSLRRICAPRRCAAPAFRRWCPSTADLCTAPRPPVSQANASSRALASIKRKTKMRQRPTHSRRT